MARKHCNTGLLGLIPYLDEQGNLFGEQGIVRAITGKPVRRSGHPGHSGSWPGLSGARAQRSHQADRLVRTLPQCHLEGPACA